MSTSAKRPAPNSQNHAELRTRENFSAKAQSNGSSPFTIPPVKKQILDAVDHDIMNYQNRDLLSAEVEGRIWALPRCKNL